MWASKKQPKDFEEVNKKLFEGQRQPKMVYARLR